MGPATFLPPHDPRRRDGLTQFMQKKTTVEQLGRKLSTISETYGMALAPYDIDRFLALAPYYFYDPALDAAPTVESVETLVRLGVPRWPLTNQGTVNETFALLDARLLKGLASAPQSAAAAGAWTPSSLECPVYGSRAGIVPTEGREESGINLKNILGKGPNLPEARSNQLYANNT